MYQSLTNPEEKDCNADWIVKYAKIVTRKAFSIPSSIRLNPHDGDANKDVISTPVQSLSSRQLSGIY